VIESVQAVMMGSSCVSESCTGARILRVLLYTGKKVSVCLLGQGRTGNCFFDRCYICILYACPVMKYNTYVA
jgi:hypothetical protein